MKEPACRTVFAGVDSRTDSDLPAWYAERVADSDEVVSFSSAMVRHFMTTVESHERRCPVCDRPLASVTVLGPAEAVLAPCGHHVHPQLLESTAF